MVRVESEILPCRGPILNHKQHAVVRSLAPEQKSAVWKWSRVSPPYCTKSVKKDGRQSARVGTRRCVRSVCERPAPPGRVSLTKKNLLRRFEDFSGPSIPISSHLNDKRSINFYSGESLRKQAGLSVAFGATEFFFVSSELLLFALLRVSLAWSRPIRGNTITLKTAEKKKQSSPSGSSSKPDSIFTIRSVSHLGPIQYYCIRLCLRLCLEIIKHTVIMVRGAFIVIEGLDRSGKTTQTEHLTEYLTTNGISIEQRKFPGE